MLNSEVKFFDQHQDSNYFAKRHLKVGIVSLEFYERIAALTLIVRVLYIKVMKFKRCMSVLGAVYNLKQFIFVYDIEFNPVR